MMGINFAAGFFMILRPRSRGAAEARQERLEARKRKAATS